MEEPGAQLVRTAPPTTLPRVKGTRRPKKRRVGYAISDGDDDDDDDDDDAFMRQLPCGRESGKCKKTTMMMMMTMHATVRLTTTVRQA